MARPREFDEAAVLEAAVECFWSRGYEATSVRDLADSMGITGASLYNAFGDKRSLYRRSLDYYVSQSFSDRVRRLEGNVPPLDALDAFFSEVIERSLADKHRKGCMLVNSALELAPHDPEFRRVIATSQSADDLARMLLSVLLGVRVLARALPKRELLEGAVRPVFDLLHARRAKRGAREP
jgi:TetR/AcrR family transcriptional regulator, transcriptional repressor for nem operon